MLLLRPIRKRSVSLELAFDFMQAHFALPARAGFQNAWIGPGSVRRKNKKSELETLGAQA
jgi:hypothetical protein